MKGKFFRVLIGCWVADFEHGKKTLEIEKFFVEGG